MKKLAIYTAITGEYDDLKTQHELPGDLYLFTDKDIKSTQYKVLPCLNLFKSFNRNAKIHKVLAHRYFPDYEYTLWIDGSILIKEDISSRIEEWKNHDLSIFGHKQRHCAYEEAEICKTHNLDRVNVINKQIDKYRSEGFPEQFGLWQCCLMLRSQKANDFNEVWWKEISEGSKRDQISFPYVVWKTGMRINAIENDFCEIHGHARLATIN